MTTSRLETFSDGVLAIIITIMVLGLKVPEGHRLSDLVHTTGTGLSTYLLSFAFVGIYWNNHHHMFHLVARVSGGVLWANLGLLFCLSLFPFTTAWMNESRFAQAPVVIYGLNLLIAAAAYLALQTVIIRQQGPESPLRQAIGTDVKGKVSAGLYLVGILSTLAIDRKGHVGVGIALACFVGSAIMWIVPDRRIDRMLRHHETPGELRAPPPRLPAFLPNQAHWLTCPAHGCGNQPVIGGWLSQPADQRRARWPVSTGRNRSKEA